LFNVDTITNSY